MLSTAGVAGKKATVTAGPAPMSDSLERLCHRCGRDIGRIESVGRRDACLHCGSDLHCCLNCRFYDPPSHNQCREPQAERQVDKQVGNFCDYFSYQRGPRRPDSSGERAKRQLDGLFAKRK